VSRGFGRQQSTIWLSVTDKAPAGATGAAPRQATFLPEAIKAGILAMIRAARR
jgi:hypothetical protein